MYPWQACLDEATNCYYYWNMVTNEVQWHPPEQLLSAAPDTQTADDDQLPGFDSEQKCEQGDLEDKDNHEEAKGDLGNQIAVITQAVRPGFRFRLSCFFFPCSVTNCRLVSRAHASLVHAYGTWNLQKLLSCDKLDF